MSKIKMALFGFILTIVLSCCGIQKSPTTGVALTPPTSKASAPQSIPTPKKDLGVVVGKLLTPNLNGEPYLATIYLGRALQANQAGFPPIISFSDTIDPKATQDNTGQFVVSDVSPGTYALIIWTPVSSHPLQDPNKANSYLLFTVLAGEVTNLGIIPIP